MLKKIYLSICVSLVFLLCCEIILFYTGIDLWAIRKILYYQCADTQVFMVSNDAQRLYELIPGVSVDFHNVHPKETKYATRTVRVNNLGFRGRDYQKIKAKGVFRIVIFGGSNTFGALVSNDDTYPVCMQRIFNKKYPGKIEVWNAGMHAYVLSQDVAYAEYITREFDPDLIIIQYTNQGRRPFLHNSTLKELKYLFHKNRELYIENTPLLFPVVAPLTTRIHRFLASYSGVYRICCSVFYSSRYVFNKKFAASANPKQGFDWNNRYADELSQQSFYSFVQKHKKIPLVSFFIFGRNNTMDGDPKEFALNPVGMPPEYFEIHPPSYVYEWYAQKLCDFLIQNNYFHFK